MSLTYTLRRWMDPSFATDSERAQMERVLEQKDLDAAGGPGEDIKLFHIELRRKALTCRVCGHRGQRGEFCPRCLADTMG